MKNSGASTAPFGKESMFSTGGKRTFWMTVELQLHRKRFACTALFTGLCSSSVCSIFSGLQLLGLSGITNGICNLSQKGFFLNSFFLLLGKKKKKKKNSFFFSALVELAPTLWAFSVFGFPMVVFIFLLISQLSSFLFLVLSNQVLHLRMWLQGVLNLKRQISMMNHYSV